MALRIGLSDFQRESMVNGCVAKAYYIFLPLLILAKVFHLSKGKKINGTF